MPTPKVYKNFAPRPNFINSATWEADGDGWQLICEYTNENGDSREIRFSTLPNNNGHAYICLPSSTDLDDLSDDSGVVNDILAAPLRASTQIGQQDPGSTEWVNALTAEGESSNIQTAIGVAKYQSHTVTEDPVTGAICYHVKVKVGNGAEKTIVLDHGDLESYSFIPQTQLLCIAGSIHKQYGNYVHDPLGGGNPPELSASERADIATYVEGLSCWV